MHAGTPSSTSSKWTPSGLFSFLILGARLNGRSVAFDWHVPESGVLAKVKKYLTLKGV